MTEESWDAVVIGAGPAGLSAAQMLGRAQRRTLVIDAGMPRNRFAAHMHGVLGQDGRPPRELLTQGRREVEAYGVEVRAATVARVDDRGAHLDVVLDGVLDRGAVETTRAIIIATGLLDDLPGIPGLAERWGSGVLHCPYCHGWEVRGRRLGVLLTSPLGLHQAQLVRQWSETVVVFAAAVHPLDPDVARRLAARGVEIVTQPVVEVLGAGADVTGARLADGRVVEIDALFTAGVSRPLDGFVAPLGLARAENPAGSFLAVDETGRTSHPRIWAAGNVVNPGANVPLSMGAGAMAGATLNAALVEEDFDRAEASLAGREGSGDHAVIVASGDHVGHGAEGVHGGSPAHAAGHAPPAHLSEGAVDAEPATFWEQRYAEADRVWSGRPNATLVEVASALPPGRALDLGCGEGADAIWLAGRGWEATGVDISPTAVARAADAARAARVDARFVAADLATFGLDELFDLVTASFLHSPVALDRADALRRAAERVAVGGRLLVIAHAAPPPWASAEHVRDHVFVGPAEDLAALALDPQVWTTEIADVRTREAVAPDGSAAQLEDGVVLVRRLR
jgi:thioredoxin reductase/SAM-dependent methyltransferase